MKINTTKHLLWAIMNAAVTGASFQYLGFQGIPNGWGLPGETDAHWTSNVPGYYAIGTNGKYVWNTNTEQFWHGVWKENRNGWRTQITFYTNTPVGTVTIEAGSVTTNSGRGYYTTPDQKFAVFELLSTDGIVLQPRWGKSLEGHYAMRISTRDYPKWAQGHDAGGSYPFEFFSNGPPRRLGACALNQMYSIKKEDNYTLTVCPILYEIETNGSYLDRVDLPCVTAKVHLKPSSTENLAPIRQP
jgi:hypothetical protein